MDALINVFAGYFWIFMNTLHQFTIDWKKNLKFRPSLKICYVLIHSIYFSFLQLVFFRTQQSQNWKVRRLLSLMMISVRVIKMLRNWNQHNLFANYGSLIALISKAIITLRAHRFSNFRIVALIAPGVELLLHITQNHPFPAPAQIISRQLQECSSSIVSYLDRSFG